MSKTHYRKVFKSDHLSVADLEDLTESGNRLVFTIKHVRQEMNATVAGRKGNFNIAYFVEDIKPLVLNATNSKTMRAHTNSQWVEDWNNIPVELYIDPDARMGENIGGVRIHPNKPKLGKQTITPDDTQNWNNAKAAFKRDGNLKAVLQRVDISEEHQQLLIDQIADEEDAEQKATANG